MFALSKKERKTNSNNSLPESKLIKYFATFRMYSMEKVNKISLNMVERLYRMEGYDL